MVNKSLFTGLCVVLAGLLSGQETASYFHQLTVEDGLSQGTNHFIYKDSKGFVWLSSLNGLNRYDGRQIKVYKPVPDDTTSLFGLNVQSSFFETKERNLWFSTWDGLNCYVRKFDHFRRFNLKNEDGSPVFGYYVFHLDVHDNLWIVVGTNQLYFFHIPTEQFIFKHDLNFKALRATAQPDGKGEVRRVFYLSYLYNGVLTVDYRQGEKTSSSIQFGDNAPVPLTVKKIELQNDSCWMATTRGLALFLPETGQLRFFHTSGKDQQELCNSLAVLDGKRLLVIIKEKGLFTFDVKQEQFIARHTALDANPNSINSDEVEHVFVDASGNVWLSSNNQGVDFFHPAKQKFQVFNLEQSSSPTSPGIEVKTLVEDDEGNVWCGTKGNGIVVYKEKTGTIQWKNSTDGPGEKKPFKDIIKMFIDRENRIWILSWQGVFRGLPGKSSIQAIPEISGIFLDGRQLKNGKIILSSFEGQLFEVKEAAGKKFTLAAILQTENAEPFTSLWENKQGRLFGCESLKNIWVMDPFDDFRLIQIIPLEGESSSFCELASDASIWIANSYGLVRLNSNNGIYAPTIYTEKNGLPSSVIYSITADDNGKLWLGTGNGISRFDPRLNQFQNFGIADGLSALHFNAFASLHRSNGQIWLGSTKGITTFYPEKVELLKVPASPVITSILINDQENRKLICEKTGATNISEIKSLWLDYQQNTISFSFAALEYSDPANTRFKYRLSRVDPDWVNAGTANFTRYAKIPPGQYTFSIMASNSDGIWSESHSIKIYIEPPFTQTPLFYSLIGVAVIGLIWGVVQYRQYRHLRIRQMEEDKRHALELERQRIARDVHDDLGSGLSALSLLTEIARYKSSEHELRTELEKINAASRELSSKIREVIWTVNASNDTLANLLSYMNQYALELLDNAEIDYHVSLPDPIPDAAIGGESRRTLFLAFKEALNNIIKHAGATKVNLDFIINPGELSISVMDNGKGFDPGLLVSSTGNGLLNMQARMRDIQGDCQFKTSSQGTQVVFSIKWTPKQV